MPWCLMKRLLVFVVALLIVWLLPLVVTAQTLTPARQGSPAAIEEPLPLQNGDFELGFAPVTIGGGPGQVGTGWTPFVMRGAPFFLAGQVAPPPNHWQVLFGPAGAYDAGIVQQVREVAFGDTLRAEARVYLPPAFDGITKSLGIDPLGGSDPLAPTVVWSQRGAGSPWHTLVVTATAAATQTTVFVRVQQPFTATPLYVGIDDVTLVRAARPVHSFLPLVVTQPGALLTTWQYHVSRIITGSTSCSSTGLRGVITGANGVPQSGVRVGVWSATSADPPFVSAPTGSDGRWQVVLNPNAPQAGRWKVAVVNAANQPISPVVGEVGYADLAPLVEAPGVPTHADCVNGHQWLHVDFAARTVFPEYTLASVRYISCLDNHLDHNIRLWVIDRAGVGQPGTTVRFQEIGGYAEDRRTGADPYKPPGYIDFPIFRRQEWTTRVLDAPSDMATGMSSTTPPIVEACAGNAWGHYSYEVVFQRRGDE